jgi:hypothetical protein
MNENVPFIWRKNYRNEAASVSPNESHYLHVQSDT